VGGAMAEGDGIYRITFAGAQTGTAGDGILVFYEGAKIAGIDAGGVQYDGDYEIDAATQSIKANIKVTVPAGVAIVQGLPPRPHQFQFDIAVDIPLAKTATPFKVSTPFGDVNVSIRLLRKLG
jgi:hypothetical protein